MLSKYFCWADFFLFQKVLGSGRKCDMPHVKCRHAFLSLCLWCMCAFNTQTLIWMNKDKIDSSRTWTCDLRIDVPGLYQLSYMYLALHGRSPYFVTIFVRGVPVRSHETTYCPLASDHAQVTIWRDTTFFYKYHVINHKGNWLGTVFRSIWMNKEKLRDFNLWPSDWHAGALRTELSSPTLAVSLFCQYLCSGSVSISLSISLFGFKSRSSKSFFVHSNLSKNVPSQFSLWFIAWHKN